MEWPLTLTFPKHHKIKKIIIIFRSVILLTEVRLLPHRARQPGVRRLIAGPRRREPGVAGPRRGARSTCNLRTTLALHTPRWTFCDISATDWFNSCFFFFFHAYASRSFQSLICVLSTTLDVNGTRLWFLYLFLFSHFLLLCFTLAFP